MLRQHGSFTLVWQGDVMLVTYTDTWNLQAVQALHEAALRTWEQRGMRPWAMLTDASQWDGGTPEVFALWWKFFEDAVAHGMQAVTDILPTHFHALIVKDLAERAARLAIYRPSENVAQARAWLASLGYSLE